MTEYGSFEVYERDDGELVIVGDCSQVAMSAKAGGKSIEKVASIRCRVLRFTDEFYRQVGALERRMDRALARSRRNGTAAKRYAHGRTQRTRRMKATWAR